MRVRIRIRIRINPIWPSRICSIVEHDVSRSRGDATMTARHLAREIATFNRLRE